MFDVKRLHSGARECNAALEILRTELGERYITKQQFADYLQPEGGAHRTGVWIASEKATEQLLGVLMAGEIDDDGVNETFHDRQSELPSSRELFRLKNRSRALIKSVAVTPINQGRGVATALVKGVLQELEAMGVRGFYALGWIRKERGCAIQGVLEPLGFKVVGDLDNFWHDESQQQGYECPDCGNPCTCAARVLVSA
jgi:GNAT superfamily N-acetyltransferase